MSAMETGTQDVLIQHIAYGFTGTYALEWLKRSPLFPMLSRDTGRLNRAVSMLVALLSSVGIVTAMNGHLTWDAGATLTLTIPPLSVLWGTVVHTVGQYAIQQGVYEGMVKKSLPAEPQA